MKQGGVDIRFTQESEIQTSSNNFMSGNQRETALEGRLQRQYGVSLDEMKGAMKTMKDDMQTLYSVIEKTNKDVARNEAKIRELDQEQKNFQVSLSRQLEEMKHKQEETKQDLVEIMQQGQRNSQDQAEIHAKAQAQAQEKQNAVQAELTRQSQEMITKIFMMPQPVQAHNNTASHNACIAGSVIGPISARACTRK